MVNGSCSLVVEGGDGSPTVGGSGSLTLGGNGCMIVVVGGNWWKWLGVLQVW